VGDRCYGASIVRSALGTIAYGALALVAIVLVGCYDVPKPECGFQCGAPAVAGGEGTCPDGYVCFTNVDNRCHRVSPPFTEPCPGDAAVPVDLTPPQLSFRSPAPDDTNVPLGARGTIQVGFTETVANFEFPNVIVEENGVIQMTSAARLDVVDGVFHYSIDLLNQEGVQRPFASNAMYTVELTDGITDFAGNEFLGAEWSFSTETDTIPPMATVQSPSTLVDVGLQVIIQINFSEPVTNVNQATFTLTGPAGIVSANVVTNGSPTTFVSLDPFSPLAPATQYTFAFSSSIADLAGNSLSFTPVTFTTASDTTSPMVTSTSPVNGSTNVSVAANLTVGFSEVVTGVNGTTFTLTGPAGLVAATIGSAAMSATLNPIHQLLPNTTYSYALTTAIVDLATNPLVAFNATFTTGTDLISPSVIGRVPNNGATNQPVNSVVLVDFDENVTNANDTTIRLVAGVSVPAIVTYVGAPMFRATLTPELQLAANTTYIVDIASMLQDASGNMFGTPPVTWTFTTGADTIVPRVLSTTPVDNATDVAVIESISVAFDEPVVGVDATSFVVMNAGAGTLASSAGGRIWTFTPDAPMPANTTVTIMLTMGIEDAAGNDLVPFTFDFTTAP
jgi:methionine-rich copper-binding protein CopC